MDYFKWSQEYFEEAQKILRNIDRLKEKLKSIPEDQRRTTEDNIMKLRMIYYECVHTAGYLASIAEERTNAA